MDTNLETQMALMQEFNVDDQLECTQPHLSPSIVTENFGEPSQPCYHEKTYAKWNDDDIWNDEYYLFKHKYRNAFVSFLWCAFCKLSAF